jgi:hypothetical protein
VDRASSTWAFNSSLDRAARIARTLFQSVELSRCGWTSACFPVMLATATELTAAFLVACSAMKAIHIGSLSAATRCSHSPKQRESWIQRPKEGRSHPLSDLGARYQKCPQLNSRALCQLPVLAGRLSATRELRIGPHGERRRSSYD